MVNVPLESTRISGCPEEGSPSDATMPAARLTCSRPACPVCGGSLMEIRQKSVCERCHSIVETCCEGGRG